MNLEKISITLKQHDADVSGGFNIQSGFYVIHRGNVYMKCVWGIEKSYAMTSCQ